VAVTSVASTITLASGIAQAGLPLGPLSTVAVPLPANLADFVKDKGAAIALGKALFWDTQVGSGGIQSCATCHFHAGADSRTTNQLSPGRLRHTLDLRD
jgi:cytochrome c peroxidase